MSARVGKFVHPCGHSWDASVLRCTCSYRCPIEVSEDVKDGVRRHAWHLLEVFRDLDSSKDRPTAVQLFMWSDSYRGAHAWDGAARFLFETLAVRLGVEGRALAQVFAWTLEGYGEASIGRNRVGPTALTLLTFPHWQDPASGLGGTLPSSQRRP